MQPLWRRVWRFLNKLKIELPYDPAILLFGMHPEEMKSLSQRVNLYAHVHRSLIAIAKTWKLAKTPSTDEWKRRTGMCTGAILAQEKNGTMTAAAP